LRAQGEKVALVALIEADNPAHTQSFSKRTQAAQLAGRLRWKRIKSHLARLLELAGRDLKSYLATRWADLRAEWLDLLFQARLDIEHRLTGRLRTLKQMLYLAGASYQPQPYSGRVAYFLCTDRAGKPEEKQDGGWTQYVQGRFETHEIPGDHLGILAAPGVDVLAEKLRKCLFAAQEAESKQDTSGQANHLR
jgi:thioesterase domain-containing protein